MNKKYFKLVYCILFLSMLLELKSQCFINSEISIGPALNSTGSEKLDGILLSEAKALKNYFKIEVELAAYDDKNSPNAFASPICRNLGCDGSVRIGKTLLLDEIVSASGYISVQGIMAHEYAHIVQFQQKSNLKGKYAELQADFLAGWYLGKAKYLTPQELTPFAESLYKKGDYFFWDVQHHGTPKERASMMVAGFENESLSLGDAYNKSISFLKSNFNELANSGSGIIVDQKSIPNNPQLNQAITAYNKGDYSLAYKEAWAAMLNTSGQVPFEGMLIVAKAAHQLNSKDALLYAKEAYYLNLENQLCRDEASTLIKLIEGGKK
jgi:hypothetical protein